jgi:hypothetical protein
MSIIARRSFLAGLGAAGAAGESYVNSRKVLLWESTRKEFRESLEQDYRRAVEEAQSGPLPKTVLAYQAVYGRLPRGWPPVT